MSTHKAVITKRLDDGLYEIRLAIVSGDALVTKQGARTAITLWGARRAARKMLADVARSGHSEGYREEIEP